MRSVAKLAAAAERISLLLELEAVEQRRGGFWSERANTLRTSLWGPRHETPASERNRARPSRSASAPHRVALARCTGSWSQDAEPTPRSTSTVYR